MNFNNGNDNNNNKNNRYYVRAVRGGKYSLLSFESIFKAYLDCRKRKRGTVNALRFEFDLLNGLFSLALDIQKGKYRPSRSVCFITRTPKLREIFAADFRDRVVHHLVVRELEKQWEPRFIFDSYACRKNKGIHAAVNRLNGWMVMPNHCHVLIELFEGVALEKIVLSWKNYSAQFINEHKGRTGVRRSQEGSQVWQREYWDRFIRDERHFEAAKKYIVMNPVNAGLVAKPEEWLWSSTKEIHCY